MSVLWKTGSNWDRASKNDPVDHFIEPVRRSKNEGGGPGRETGIAEQNSRTGRGGPNTLPQWIILGSLSAVVRAKAEGQRARKELLCNSDERARGQYN